MLVSSTQAAGLHQPLYQTDNLIHTLLNLAAIRTPLFDPAKSVVNPNFQALPRWINNTPYAK
jgi:heptose-I-phosphate ethanolaminephosphotransferase